MTDLTQTIPGSYTLVPMPDGTEVMMHRLSDGKWVTTEERARMEESAQFMARFQNTDFAPKNHAPVTEGALKPRPGAEGPLTGTLNRIDAYLGEILGDPALIMAKDTLAMERVAKVRARPQEMRHVLGLLTILNKPEWNAVRAVLQG